MIFRDEYSIGDPDSLTSPLEIDPDPTSAVAFQAHFAAEILFVKLQENNQKRLAYVKEILCFFRETNNLVSGKNQSNFITLSAKEFQKSSDTISPTKI